MKTNSSKTRTRRKKEAKAIVNEREAITEDEISPQDVADFISAVDEANKSKKEEVLKEITPKKETKEVSSFNKVFSSDPSFIKDEIEEEVRKYMFNVDGEDLEITDEDQGIYLRAILNDCPVKLSVPLMGGNINIVCRSLSAYESSLLFLASRKMADAETKPENAVLIPGCAQQIRTAMQITEVNGVAQDYIHIDEITDDRDKLVNDIVIKTEKITSKISSAKYGVYVRALNVFENKLAKMNELAHTGTFWKPVGTD